MEDTLRSFAAILGVVVIYLIIKQSKEQSKETDFLYDLIVSIKVEPAPNILQHATLNQVAKWEIYGKGVFRGQSTIKKEEMKQLLMKELCLTEEHVIVIDATDNFVKLRA